MTDDFAPGAPAHRANGETPDLRVVPDDGPLAGAEPAKSQDHAAWRAVGLELARERRASDLEWRLGDWAAQADGEFATLAEAAAIADESLSNIKKYVATAKAFPPVRRRTGIAFFLHYEVVALPQDEGESLLDQAAAGNWTRVEMRAAVAEMRDRRNADLASRNEELAAENERLRARLANGDKEHEETRQVRKRLRASHRVVRDEAQRAVALVAELSGAVQHGNRKNGVANAAIDGFRVLSADIRTAHADVAHSIERIAGRSKTPVEAAVSVLMDDTMECWREIARRLAEAKPGSSEAARIKSDYDARAKAIRRVLKEEVDPAFVHCADGEDSE